MGVMCGKTINDYRMSENAYRRLGLSRHQPQSGIWPNEHVTRGVGGSHRSIMSGLSLGANSSTGHRAVFGMTGAMLDAQDIRMNRVVIIPLMMLSMAAWVLIGTS